MCGIVGVFGNVSVQDEKVFKELLIVGQLRGNHSTGAMAVKRANNEVVVAKAVGTPDQLLDMKQFDKVMAGNQRFLLGHNRYATQGKVNHANAHPFNFDHVTGVHNGSLRNYTQLDGYGEFPVDSQVLYHHISKHGLRDAVDNFSGAAALVWWDSKENEVNIWKNSERPLSWGLTASGAIYIASEFEMLEWILHRNNMKMVDGDEFSNDLHHRWKLEVNQTSGLKPVVTKVEKKLLSQCTTHPSDQRLSRRELKRLKRQQEFEQRHQFHKHGK